MVRGQTKTRVAPDAPSSKHYITQLEGMRQERCEINLDMKQSRAEESALEVLRDSVLSKSR